ncbi:MAG TPA: site-2 protease family protein [Solirubrobacteraceae bacterium]|jgi:Zn-dependent protease|nr:site-2 protease family protein [Solirubrobacteraceae bacterium]
MESPSGWSLLDPPPPVTTTPPPAAGAAQAFGRPKRSWLREKLGAAGAAIVALLAKVKAVLLFLPKIKLLATAGTALVSVAAYASIWGWQFAVGFVVLIFIHEMGHVVALRRHGIHASAPMFIPFMGAVIWARSLGNDALTEARVGLAGPIAGGLASAVVAIVGLATHTELLEALGYIGFLLNLFNLLPVTPLDGGRAMAAMAPWLWFAGFGGLVLLEFLEPNPILLIICLVAAYDLYNRWHRRNSPSALQSAYYRVSPRNRVLVGIVYLALIAGLAVGMHFTYLHRTI